MSYHFDAFGRLAWSQLWQVTAVILLVGLLVHFFCRRRPHWAYALWLVALLKCLTPPIWSSPTGVFSWAGAERSAAAAATREPASLGQDAALEPSSPMPPPKSDVPREAAGVASTQPDRTMSASGVLAIVWLCGAAALSGLLIGRRSYYHVLLHHHRVETGDAVRRLVARLSRQLGLRRRVNVLVTTRPFGPAVFGLWRPTLILPEMLVREGPSPQVERMIAHELIHVRRGDHWIGALQLFAQIVWWFHPLVWWINRRICYEREYCCDEQVVANLNCDPGGYAQGLLDVLKLRRQLRPALLPGMDASEVTTKRLENIMDQRRTFYRRMPRVCWVMLVAGILFIAPGAGLTLPGGTTGSSPTAENESPEQPGATDPSSRTSEETAKAAEEASEPAPGAPPCIVKTSPEIGATDVDPALTEITVTFNRDMGGGFSWTGGGPEYPPGRPGKKPFWRDKQTCVFPVTLERARYYRIGINSTSFRNFSSAAGIPARPSAIYFTTEGASPALKMKVKRV